MITIIPAIDIIGGECVRLTQGDYSRKTTYHSDPLEVAKMYEDAGLGRLHLVDLDGAKSSSPVNLRILEKIAARTTLEVQYGGGIKSAESLQDVFSAGAARAVCGSIAVAEPDSFRCWLKVFGPGRIVLGADVRDGFVATHGWLRDSGAAVSDVIAGFLGEGLSQVICTDISKDGMLAGPSFGLYAELQAEFPGVEITVSGGISSLEDVVQLDKMGLKSVIVGKAIYEGKISMGAINEYLSRH